MAQNHISATTNGENVEKKKKMILNAFVMNSPGHLATGFWKHPRNKTTEYTKLKFWTDLAQMLDKAGFHALFVADVLGAYDIYKGPGNHGPVTSAGAQFPINDPLYTVPAMAAVTKNLTFGITASTTYEAPYALARRFSTVDHLSEGRVAWNIVTSYLESAARNFGLSTQIEHDERYRIADEYMDVVYKLWEGSWRDDAVVKDLKTGQYAVPERVRQIHHEGKYFKVPGPHLCEPSPQRTPFLFQAGTSPSGRDFGAKHAEAIFVSGQDPAKVRKSVDAIRQLAKDKYGRDPSHVKVILGMIIIVAETDAAAEAKMEEMRPYGDRDGALAMFGGWTGIDLSQYPDDADFRFSGPSQIQGFVNNWAAEVPGSNNLKWTKSTIADYLMMGGLGAKACGSPKTVVDELERWMELADIDGFNLGHIINPGSFEDIIEFVLPELQSRGLFRTGVEKAGATTREVFFGEGGGFLLGDHPGRKFRWNPDDPSTRTNYNAVKVVDGPSQQALVVTREGQFKVDPSFPMPIIEKDNEIMIRSRAVGLNHIDWKSVQYNICLPSFPWIMGREMAGVVEKVGSAVTDFKVGDHVWTSTYYRDRRAGCFQEFVVVPELTVSSIPSNLTFESAACLGVGAITAAMTLWKWLEVPMPSALSVSSSEEAANAEQYILIWGGSTIVGQFAIQIALRGNFNVIAVSSEESRSIIEEFGNVHVVTRCNRSNGEIIAEIRKIGGDRTVKAMDLVGSETAACCIRALSTTLPSIFAHLVTMPKSLSIPSNITVREVAMKKFVLDESSKAYSTELNEIVQSGVVKLPQISILEGGLSRVDEGLRILQMGGMKGRKLVVSM